MRLWHESLITKLPRQQLLGQHRECCALRGNSWGRKHSTVDYVFTHPWYFLVLYHQKVMDEMKVRGYHPDLKWENYLYRGLSCEPREPLKAEEIYEPEGLIYPEHNDDYLIECLKNLENKGVIITL